MEDPQRDPESDGERETPPATDPIREAGEIVDEMRLVAEQVADFRETCPEFLKHAATPIVIANQKGQIIFYNEKAVFLFGYLRDEVVGQPVEVLLPESLREVHAHVHRKGYTRDPYPRAMGANLKLRARHKNGSEFPVLIDLLPMMGRLGFYVQATVRRAPVDG